VSDFINARAGDVAAYDAYCEAGNPEVECEQCGDRHSPTRCPWADTCEHCSRTDATMAEPRLCVDCAEELDRAAARQARLDAYEGRGDYLRDQQKDERR
jgi:hypothetical protein